MAMARFTMPSVNSPKLRVRARDYLVLVCLSLRVSAVHAQTDEIQVYDGEIAAPGQFTLVLHNNFTTSGSRQPNFPGGVPSEGSLNGVPEWGYGVSDWFEAGLYLPVYTHTRDGKFLFDSVKLRALFVVPLALQRRWFYGVNFELSYNARHWDQSRYSGEIRPIVGTHLGRWTLVFNPILDTSFDGLGNLDFAPAARVAFDLSEKWGLAVEHYADFGPVRHFVSKEDQAHTLFVVLDHSGHSGGFEFGIGHGLNRASDSLVFKLLLMRDLSPQPSSGR